MHIVVVGLILAGLVIGGSAQASELTTGKAVRYDTTTQTIQELVGARRNAPIGVVTPYEVPNRLSRRTPVDPGADPDFEDPLVANSQSGLQTPQALLSFDGYSSDDNVSVAGGRITPPDTNGDVGLDYYVTYNNIGWAFYDKDSGALVAGPFIGNSFWTGFGGVCETNNAGDPIVLFDAQAEQWVFTQFTSPTNPDGTQCFAISEGSDPQGPYHRYEFTVSPGEFNDYPKVGVWTDGAGQSAYHYTGRNFNLQTNFATNIEAIAFERDAMLNGESAEFVRGVLTSFDPDGVMPPNLENGPDPAPTGRCGLYGVADAADNEYKFWEFCVNWDDVDQSTLTQLADVPTAPFDDNLGNIRVPFPGQALDNLAFFTYFAFNQTVIDGKLKGVLGHTVDLGGGFRGRAGIRWAIFDLDPGGISLDDTGTLGPADSLSRWMGALVLDSVGNLGLGYTVADRNTFPSVAFTGRETSDPAGTLRNETSCVEGTGVQTGATRWGDYATASVDPVDGCTFYIYAEYVKDTGNFDWDTRVCAFEFPSCAGGGEPPTDLSLAVTPGEAGEQNSFLASNATPEAFTVFYFASAAGATDVSVGGCEATLGLDQGSFWGIARADDGGDAEVVRNVFRFLGGSTLSFQALDLSACQLSNVVETTF